MADHDAADAEAVQQHGLHEILRASARHLGIEGQREQRVHAQIRQQPRLCA